MENPFGQLIRLGVDRRGIQRPGPVGNPQKTRRLFESLRPQPLHLQQVLPPGKRAVFLPMADDAPAQRGIEPGNILQKGGRGGIEIDSDAIDT